MSRAGRRKGITYSAFAYISLFLILPIGTAEAGPVVFDINRASSYLSIAADSTLEPTVEKTLLVSFLIRFDRLPNEGDGYTIVSKYDSEKPPHPGWAIAVQQLSTSLRFRIYWRDTFGKGGWFTFDRTEIVPRRWYGISFVARSSEFLNLYIQPLSAPFAEVAPEADRAQSGVQFAGGFGISELGLPINDSSLRFGAVGSARYSFRGEISSVLIGNVDSKGMTASGIKQLLTGGPRVLRDKLETNQIQLWLSASGKDESRFARGVEIVGSVSKREINE